jgi:spermidine synthase
VTDATSADLPIPDAPRPLIKAAGWLYPATTFLSAALLFTLQPLFAKMLTPLMGGSPAVWNTALVFYQTALLAGYFYAHILATRFKPRVQLVIHAAVLAFGLIFLPIKVSGLVGAPNVGNPVGWTLAALALSLGGPIVAISATAPLIQSWRARLGDAVDPYRLYAASNLGSFIALAAFPFLIEPLIGAKVQALVWTVGYVVLAVALVTAIWAVPATSQAPREVAQSQTTWLDRLKWVFFAAPPSALLVAVTTHLSTDVASVPLIWIPPLALFLLTFIIAFSAWGDKMAEVASPMKFMVVFLLAAVMGAKIDQEMVGLGIHLVAFFLIVLCCHLELAARRPEPARLTEFYLWMSLGGVLGGAAAALLAPVILNTTLEYQIALAAALAVGAWARADLKWALPAVVIAVTAALLYRNLYDVAVWLEATVPIGPKGVTTETPFWFGVLAVWRPEFAAAIFCSVMALAAIMAQRSALLVAAIGGVALILPVIDTDSDNIKFRERSFFGVLEITDSGKAPDGWRFLSHGTTLHGVMSLDPARNREPMSYYWRETPLGSLYQEASAAKPTDLHAGVIGMGMGSTTCYAKPGQSWKIFEIDDDVIKASMNPNLVGFINRCAPNIEIVRGDARLRMKDQPNDWFDILLVDAFSSDAIPTHMITKEAIALFMSKMNSEGVLIVHISNRYLDLGTIVSDAANDLGYAVMEGNRNGEASNPNADTGVRAVIIAKSQSRLERYRGNPMWTMIGPSKESHPWTDDHTDILRALVRQNAN